MIVTGVLAMPPGLDQRRQLGCSAGQRRRRFGRGRVGGDGSLASTSLVQVVTTALTAGLLTDLLARLAGHPAKRVAESLPWNWSPPAADALKAA